MTGDRGAIDSAVRSPAQFMVVHIQNTALLHTVSLVCTAHQKSRAHSPQPPAMAIVGDIDSIKKRDFSGVEETCMIWTSLLARQATRCDTAHACGRCWRRGEPSHEPSSVTTEPRRGTRRLREENLAKAARARERGETDQKDATYRVETVAAQGPDANLPRCGPT